MELRSSKAKLFCETSFKNEASKLKNQAFLRDFLQKWSFEALKRSFSARFPSKMILRARIGSQATTKGTHQFCVTGVGLQAHLVTCDPMVHWSLVTPPALHHSMVTIRLLHFNFIPHAFHTAMVYNVILHVDLLPAVHKAMVYSMYIYIYPSKTFLSAFWTLKRSFSARLPSKMKLRNSKTKLFCGASFKSGASKL